MNYDKSELRRNQMDLLISGRAVIFFGAWSIIKCFFEMSYSDGFKEVLFGDNRYLLEKYLILIFIILLQAFDLFLRVYVGKKAIETAQGHQTSNTYVYLAILLLVVSLLSCYECFRVNNIYISSADRIITIVVELTSSFNFCELIYSSRKVKRLQSCHDERE